MSYVNLTRRCVVLILVLAVVMTEILAFPGVPDPEHVVVFRVAHTRVVGRSMGAYHSYYHRDDPDKNGDGDDPPSVLPTGWHTRVRRKATSVFVAETDGWPSKPPVDFPLVLTPTTVSRRWHPPFLTDPPSLSI